MSLLLLEDVTSRQSRVGQCPSRTHINLTGTLLYDESNHTFYERSAIEQIKHWPGLNEDSNIAFSSALDALNLMIEHSTSMSAIRTACDQLVNESTQVTNSKELKRSLKYKLNTVKRKLKPFQPPKKSKSTLSQQIQANNDAKLPTDANGKRYQREDVANECYDRLISRASRMYEADRIIENYTKVSKRFNLDKIFKEYALDKRDLYTTVYEVAGLIATFAAPFKNLYTSTLECCWYGLNKRYLCVPNKAIIEAATDFYVFNEGLIDLDIEDIKSVRDTSPIFEKADFECLAYLDERGPIDKDGNIQPMENNTKGDGRSSEPKVSMSKDFYTDQQNKRGNHKEPFSYIVFEKPKDTQGIPDPDDYGVGGKETAKKQEPLISKLREAVENALTPKNNIEKALDRFRAACSMHDDIQSNLESFEREFIEAIKAHPHEIVAKLKSILQLIRNIFVFDVGITEIEKISTSVYDIAHLLYDIGISKEEYEICMDAFSTEMNYIQMYLDKYAPAWQREGLKRYLGSLRECMLNIRDYGESVLRINLSESRTNPVEDAKKGLFCLNLLQDINECSNGSNITSLITENIIKLSNDTIMSIVEFANTCPELINKAEVLNELCAQKERCKFKESISNAMRIDLLNEAIDKLKKSEVYGAYKDMDGLIGCLMCVDEIIRTISGSQHNQYITESSCIDTIRSILDDVRSRFATDKPGTITGIVIRSFNNFDQTPKETSLSDALCEALRAAMNCIIATNGAIWMAKPMYYIIQSFVEYFTRGGLIRVVVDKAIKTLTDCSDQCTDAITRLPKTDSNELFIRFCVSLKKQFDIAIGRIKYAHATVVQVVRSDDRGTLLKILPEDDAITNDKAKPTEEGDE